MLLTFLRYLRRQSKAVRNNYAMAIAGTFTALVGMMWLYTGILTDSGEPTLSSGQERNPPFSNLWKQTKEQWAGARQALQAEINASSTASTTDTLVSDSRTLILTEETINESVIKVNSTSTTESYSDDTSVRGGIEVQIATTSSTSSPNRTD